MIYKQAINLGSKRSCQNENDKESIFERVENKFNCLKNIFDFQGHFKLFGETMSNTNKHFHFKEAYFFARPFEILQSCSSLQT